MDLYALLGVTRAASPGEIERAYRRLARRYHPGINPGDRAAAEMFRQVHYAFGVLCDEERRREYDRGIAKASPEPEQGVSVELQGFDFSMAAHGAQAATFAELFADVFQQAAREAIAPSRGADIDVTQRISFRDAVRGGTFPMSIVRQDRCVSCGGDGRVARPPMICPACEGMGSRRWARGHMVFTRPCDDCGATGHISTQTCRGCAGAGIQPRSEVVTVT